MGRLSLLLGVLMIVAGSSASASAWSPQTTITGFYIDTNASVLYLKTPSNLNPDGCANSSYLAISTSAPFFKELHATIMAAHLSGSQVSLLYSGCLGVYPKISIVAVPNIW